LPGQYFDQESGLHYNRQRYYDPSQGTYLSPDPLGNPDGANAYAYAANNPITNVDPDGLILFAFDGTGNTNDAGDLSQLGNGLSNVWQFRQLYDDGNRQYVTGVGTRHRDTRYGDIAPGITGTNVDMGTNATGRARIERMEQYFKDEVQTFDVSQIMQIDIIGFSRGAAQARDFANRLQAPSKSTRENGIDYKTSGLVMVSGQNGEIKYYYRQTTENRVTIPGINEGKLLSVSYKCQQVNFRFLGLFDSVISTDLNFGTYNLSIPANFSHVSHAVALNEYRGRTSRDLSGSTGAFPLESVMRGPVSTVTEQTLVERGFIGAHADIGGGFRGQENGVPLVALNWMVQQARDAGVKMRDAETRIRSTVIHDKSDILLTGGMGAGEDRQVRFRDGTTTTQRQMTGTGLTYAEIARLQQPGSNQNLISFSPDRGSSDFVTGTVNMDRYLAWLRGNGYKLGGLEAR
jgi:RHS repeat-associated protein